MVKKFFRSLICMMLVFTMAFTACVPCGLAATKSVKVLRVNAQDVRMHYTAKGEGENNMVCKIKKGTRVLYLGTESKVWYKVRTEKGLTGYIYMGYLDEYGAVAKNSLYTVNTSRLQTYKRSGNRLKKASSRLSGGTLVSVKATKNGYAYVQTLSGKKTYVKLSGLKKLF